MRQKIFVSLTLLALLGACEPTIANRGNVLDQDKLAEVTVGTSTREDVVSKLGSPTMVSTFDEKVWYYTGRQTQQYAFLDPEVLKQHALEVRFDDKGTVTAMTNLDISQAQDIDPVNRTTPTYGNDDTFIKQLIGNLGHRHAGYEPAARRPIALFRREAEIGECVDQFSRKQLEKGREVFLQPRKAVMLGQVLLVHIKLTVDLELQRMKALLRLTVTAHDFHTHIGIIKRDAYIPYPARSRARGA